jgi:glycosyltransferase involved in cell wall biosynthesis
LIGVDASRAAVGQRTGTENYSLHLIRALISIAPHQHFRLYLRSAPPPGLFLPNRNCELCVIPFPRLWTHLRLSTEMLIHPPEALFVPAHVLPLVHPPASIVTIHDLGHRHFPGMHTSSQRRYLEWSTRYHVRSAAHIIADSCATKRDLTTLYDADPEQVTVAYLGIEPSFGPPLDPQFIASVKQRHGLSGPYLLYVGTIQPRKNLLRLLDAFQHLLASDGTDNDLTLVLAGKQGWMSDGVLSRIRTLGLEQRVLLPGYVAPSDLPALYAGARLFVMPSLYEGFCMPVLEAMACGTPVVCSNTSSLPEVVGSAALTFDPLDSRAITTTISTALCDSELRSRLVALGTRRAQEFTWARCAKRVLKAVNDARRSLTQRKIGDNKCPR